MLLRLHHFDLPLAHVFTISRGSISVQETLVVELSQDGMSGYGEATTNDYYGFTLENMAAALKAIEPRLNATTLEDPAELWDDLYPALKDNPFAHCALDQAACDLWGKLSGAPVYKLWGLSAEKTPLTDYTIGID